mgnify:CR=1 FL=1
MIWLLLVFGSASIVFITDNDAVEGFFALFSIIGLIGWIKHAKRRAEEGGNWLSNKPSVDEIVRQQLAEEESGLPHIIIDPSKLTNRIAHADHEFDFLCSRCGSLSGDLISRATHTREDPRSLSNVIQGAVTVLLFMIPHLLRWFDDDNEIMVCNDCGNQSRF